MKWLDRDFLENYIKELDIGKNTNIILLILQKVSHYIVTGISTTHLLSAYEVGGMRLWVKIDGITQYFVNVRISNIESDKFILFSVYVTNSETYVYTYSPLAKLFLKWTKRT